MAHYERLANGKYAYTETIQLISGEDFTNEKHGYITGTFPLYIGKTQDSWTHLGLIPEFTVYNPTYGIFNTQGVYINSNSSPQTFDAISPSDWNVVSRTIAENTYYGLQTTATDDCIVLKIVSNGNYYIRLESGTFVLTYIEGATNTIKTKNISFTSNLFEAKTGIKTYYDLYICLGITTDDIILNLNLQPITN